MINNPAAWDLSEVQKQLLVIDLRANGVVVDDADLSPKEQLSRGDIRLPECKISLELKYGSFEYPGSVSIGADYLNLFPAQDIHGFYVVGNYSGCAEDPFDLTNMYVFEAKFVRDYMKIVRGDRERRIRSAEGHKKFRVFLFENQLHNAESWQNFVTRL